MHNRYMDSTYRKRRIFSFLVVMIGFVIIITINSPIADNVSMQKAEFGNASDLATTALKKLLVKGRAPKTDYSREMFGSGWSSTKGCDARNLILNRDMKNVVVDSKCNVMSGTLSDPYTGGTIQFKRSSSTSSAVQIDHVVALSDAWQKGAQQLKQEERTAMANDPLELIAVDGPSNVQKGDGDAATWLPASKSFRCQYIARQIAVKTKYKLWVTQSEYKAMETILAKCPGQLLPTP